MEEGREEEGVGGGRIRGKRKGGRCGWAMRVGKTEKHSEDERKLANGGPGNANMRQREHWEEKRRSGQEEKLQAGQHREGRRTGVVPGDGRSYLRSASFFPHLPCTLGAHWLHLPLRPL